MRHQQHKPGEQQQAKNAELNVPAAMQELVPAVEVLGERHQENEHRGEDQHCAAAKHASLGHPPGPFRMFVASIETALQRCTTRFPANLAQNKHVMDVDETVQQFCHTFLKTSSFDLPILDFVNY